MSSIVSHDWTVKSRVLAWSPVRFFAVSATLTLIIMTLPLTGCGSDDPDFAFARGRSIEIHAQRPVMLEKVSFSSTSTTGGVSTLQHRIIRPKASNRQLAAVQVTVVNRTSTVMPLLIDPEAARLGDRRGQRINALDPFDRSDVIEAADEEENKYSPLLWGDIQLDRNFQVAGWVIFDVPKGLTLGTLWWNEVDEVVADYIQYVRR
jgi:hypothetical protein